MVLQHFRLAYLSEAWVNWCPALGTVLANDEVKDGVSERAATPWNASACPSGACASPPTPSACSTG